MPVRAYVFDAVGGLWDTLCTGDAPSNQQIAQEQRRIAAEAETLLFAAGTAALALPSALGQARGRAGRVLPITEGVVEAARRGLGTYMILDHIAYARRLGVPYLYLGYWIRESPKMAYKSKFEPIEGFAGGTWRRLGRREAM